MALPDLTGQNIENTYQRVLQTDGTIIYDGTGSVFLPVSASYSITASYAEYAVSASHEIVKEVSSSYADYAKESGLATSSISASYALTASYALNSPDVFPYTGSAIISGSLVVTGSTEIQYLTASGLNYPAIDGDEKQLITTDGSGNLFFDWADRTNLDVKNTSGTTLALGTPVYISGFQGASIFQISPSSASISSSMPAVGVLSQELAPNEQGHATILGALRGYNTSLYSVNDSLYVGEGILTKDRPTGSALIQKIARVGNSQNNGEITIIGAGRSNDVPNLPPGYAWVGGSTWNAVATPTSSFNEDPFPYTGSAVISGSLDVTGNTAFNSGLEVHSGNSSMYFESGSSIASDDGKIYIESTGGPSNISLNRTDGAQLSLLAGGSFAGFYYPSNKKFGIQPMSNPATATNFPSATSLVLDGVGNVGIGTSSPSTNLDVIGNTRITGNITSLSYITASTYYGDGSNLTGIETDPFPYTGSAIISGSFTVTGSIISTDTVTAVTGSFSHLKGNSPITIQDPVTFQHAQGLDVLGNATIHSINEVELQTISKDISYTSSINVTEIPSSVNGMIIDYRLTNLNSGSRVGTFMYAHDGTELSYNDLTIPGGGIGSDPILSATLTGSIVSLDIENAAGFNFTGYAKKFNKLGAPIPIANPNAPIPLLDTYNNAEAAFSLRKLSTLHTGSAIRVREDGFDTEIDIGFDINNNLDTSTLSAHCGSNNGYVVTWYDQSGNNNDATQTAAANQPQIVSNGNVIFEGGNPAIQGTNSSKLLLNSTIELSSEFSHFTLCTTVGTDNPWGGDASGAEQTTWVYFSNINTNWRLINSTGLYSYSIPNIPGGTLVLQNHIRSTNNSTPLYLNGDITNSPTVNGTFYVKVIMGSNWFNYAGRAQEIIFYKSDQSSNREGIETNINTHYNIYDTGLLAEYSGAAAAYSVRQLTTAYTGSALRIREDGTNTETDIGFDSNGDLDTASIASHCGANNGLVVTWYDQSGNGNNATQSTVGNQPKIYDGTTGVLTRNGKPYIDTRTSGTLPVSSFAGNGTAGSYFAVTDTSGGFIDPMFGTYNNGMHGEYGIYLQIVNGGQFSVNAGYPSTSRFILSYTTIDTVNGSEAAIQGATASSFASTATIVRLGGISVRGTSGVKYTGGFMYEIVFYDSNQSANRTGIETNINSYFNIYS